MHHSEENKQTLALGTKIKSNCLLLSSISCRLTEDYLIYDQGPPTFHTHTLFRVTS